MANKALGRDLGDLLSRARHARFIDRVGAAPAAPVAPGGAALSLAGTGAGDPAAGPVAVPMELPLTLPGVAGTAPVVPSAPGVTGGDTVLHGPTAALIQPATAAVPTAPAGSRTASFGTVTGADGGGGAVRSSRPGALAGRSAPVSGAGSAGTTARSTPSAVFLLFVVLDVILMTAAILVATTDWVERPMSTYLAAGAVLAGGICAALAYLLRPAAAPKPEPSRVRVHLRRV